MNNLSSGDKTKDAIHILKFGKMGVIEISRRTELIWIITFISNAEWG